MNTMQASTTTNSSTRSFWAFAVDQTRPRHIRRRNIGSPRKHLERYYITSLSPRLKELGVQVGMNYKQAKQLVPEMRVIICNR